MPLKLHVVKGKEPGRVIPVPDGGSVVIGRRNADVCLDDQMLSRQHVRVEARGGEAVISDLASSNGTYLNGDKIAQARLADGDKIKIGGHILHVEMSAGAAGAEGASAAARAGVRALAGQPLGRRELVFCAVCWRAVPRDLAAPDPGGIRCADCAEGGAFDPLMIEGFKLVERIADGRLGPVFKAKHLTLGKNLTVKVIRSAHAVDEQTLRRFAREAKIGGRLHHPNIVAMYDAAESGGHYYIVLEYVDGETLEERIAREKRVPAAEAVRIGVAVAEALRHAWEAQKVIHRDVKPANIFLSRKGEVKLGDFGLAKPLDPSAAAEDVTPLGETWGTLHTMSPEQLEGTAAVDARTDIYSLGASLYHAVSGLRPFEAPSVGETIERIRAGGLEPADRAAGWQHCPRPLAACIARAMERDRAQRYQTAAEMLAALQTLNA